MLTVLIIPNCQCMKLPFQLLTSQSFWVRFVLYYQPQEEYTCEPGNLFFALVKCYFTPEHRKCSWSCLVQESYASSCAWNSAAAVGIFIVFQDLFLGLMSRLSTKNPLLNGTVIGFRLLADVCIACRCWFEYSWSTCLFNHRWLFPWCFCGGWLAYGGKRAQAQLVLTFLCFGVLTFYYEFCYVYLPYWPHRQVFKGCQAWWGSILCTLVLVSGDGRVRQYSSYRLVICNSFP